VQPQRFCSVSAVRAVRHCGQYQDRGTSIGSGVRRIEAVVSKAAESYVEKQQDAVAELADTLSARPDDPVGRVNRLQSEMRDLQKALAEINVRLASADAKLRSVHRKRHDMGNSPLIEQRLREPCQSIGN
jgi:alanyl-tRNA synthetase